MYWNDQDKQATCLTHMLLGSPLNTDVSDVMDARDARTSKIWPLPSRCSHSLVSKTKKQLNELERGISPARNRT